MNVRARLALASLLVLTGAEAHARGPERSASTRGAHVERLGDEVLQNCLSHDRALALVRVRSVSIAAQGTRSESTNAAILVERLIHGSLARELTAWRWSGHGHPLVHPGRLYVMMLAPNTPRSTIGAWVEVPAGAEDEAVRVHREALERLKKATP